MCGICGVYNLSGKPVHSGLISQMTKVLRHRGPDDQGLYTNNSIALGMTRLAIIDLSQAAHQPMSNADGTVWIVYNGEVYNHLQLRKELEAKGYRYQSQSDTETVLHLYEEYGIACLQYLRGMYAFAIWDTKQHKLFLAIDRLGIKPLYYTQVNGSIIFGSEIKVILQYPEVKREIDFISMDEYLRYSCVPAPRTIFKGIKRLPPAHYVTVNGTQVEVQSYWDLHFEPNYSRSETEWVKITREMLTECVEMRLMSDVPLGVLLSGGIDSSSVVALMSQTSTEKVKTFTIGFETAGLDFRGYDERHDARIIAQRFNTDHHEMIVNPQVNDVMPSIIWHFDEPFANVTAIPAYYLSKMTREYVTVALGGVGGDEAFGGYPRYIGARWLKRFFTLPPLLRKRVVTTIERLPEGSSDYLFTNRLKKFFRGMSTTKEKTYANWMSFFNGNLSIYSQGVREQLVANQTIPPLNGQFRIASGLEFLNKLFFVDTKMYLPDNLLTYSDRMSMAHSLELRVPFCDHLIIEFAGTIPPELKAKGFTLKYILKKVMRDILPHEILHKRKQGFSVPLSHWLRHELRPLASKVLSPHRIKQRGYFDPEVVSKLWTAHFSGKANYANYLWALIVFDLWHTLYIDEVIKSKPSLNLSELLET